MYPIFNHIEKSIIMKEAGLILVLFIGCLLSSTITAFIIENRWKNQAIEHHVAQYNPKSGELQWKE